jgi:hypothetical protein
MSLLVVAGILIALTGAIMMFLEWRRQQELAALFPPPATEIVARGNLYVFEVGEQIPIGAEETDVETGETREIDLVLIYRGLRQNVEGEIAPYFETKEGDVFPMPRDRSIQVPSRFVTGTYYRIARLGHYNADAVQMVIFEKPDEVKRLEYIAPGARFTGSFYCEGAEVSFDLEWHPDGYVTSHTGVEVVQNDEVLLIRSPACSVDVGVGNVLGLDGDNNLVIERYDPYVYRMGLNV